MLMIVARHAEGVVQDRRPAAGVYPNDLVSGGCGRKVDTHDVVDGCGTDVE